MSRDNKPASTGCSDLAAGGSKFVASTMRPLAATQEGFHPAPAGPQRGIAATKRKVAFWKRSSHAAKTFRVSNTARLLPHLTEKFKDVLPVVRVSLSLAVSIFSEDQMVRTRHNPQVRIRSGRTLELISLFDGNLAWGRRHDASSPSIPWSTMAEPRNRSAGTHHPLSGIPSELVRSIVSAFKPQSSGTAVCQPYFGVFTPERLVLSSAA
jgi:hypothetical protein